MLPRKVRPHRILGGPLRGFRLVTSWHDYPAGILGRTESALLDWFERTVVPGETWLDVGAHYGYTAIALSRLVGAQGRVFAFEPALATAGHLSQTRALNNLAQLTIIGCGLADPETVDLRGLPSIRGMLDSTVPTRVGLPQQFLAARLDWLWGSICGGQRRIDGVKVDVQGMEIATIRGMAALLREFQPRLVIELHHGVDRGVLLGLLRSVGYSDSGLAIEGADPAGQPMYLDDRSYVFGRSKLP